MMFRQKASRVVLKMTVCLGVAGGCAFLGCSSEYGSSTGATKENLKGAFGEGAPEVNQAGKGARNKIMPKSIKQKIANSPPAN